MDWGFEVFQGYFSIAVAAFLLIRLERDIQKLTAAIERLRYCQVCRVPRMYNEKNENAPQHKPL
jgi:hypothetical protein